MKTFMICMLAVGALAVDTTKKASVNKQLKRGILSFDEGSNIHKGEQLEQQLVRYTQPGHHYVVSSGPGSTHTAQVSYREAVALPGKKQHETEPTAVYDSQLGQNFHHQVGQGYDFSLNYQGQQVGQESYGYGDHASTVSPLEVGSHFLKTAVGVAHQVPVGVQHQVATEVPHQVTVGAQQQVPVQVSHQVPVQVSRQVPVQVSHQVPVQVSHQAPVQVSHQVPVQVSHQAPVQVSHQVPVQVSHQVPVRIQQRVPIEAQKRVPVSVSHQDPFGQTVQIPAQFQKSIEVSRSFEIPVQSPETVYVTDTHEVQQPIPIVVRVPSPFTDPVAHQKPLNTVSGYETSVHHKQNFAFGTDESSHGQHGFTGLEYNFYSNPVNFAALEVHSYPGTVENREHIDVGSQQYNFGDFENAFRNIYKSVSSEQHVGQPAQVKTSASDNQHSGYHYDKPDKKFTF